MTQRTHHGLEIVATVLAFVLALALAGCGARSNLLGLATPDQDRQPFDYLLVSAQAAYDRNDLKEALKLSKKAFDIDPLSERASILYGFVNLSLARADPFTLAGLLAKTPTDDPNTPENEAATSDDSLGRFTQALRLPEADLLRLGDLDESVPDLPVLLPSCVEDVRTRVDVLHYLDEAIKAVCPFVDLSARVLDDERQACLAAPDVRSSPDRAHFLWAFAHLSEALSFHAVLTYAPGSIDGRSNVTKRVELLQTPPVEGVAGLASFLEGVGELEVLLSRVLPTSGICSEAAPTTQLTATLDDMLAVSLAFDLIPGSPPAIRASIDLATSALRKVRDDGAQRSAQASVLKADFTRKAASGLAQKIDEAAAKEPPTPDQRAVLCTHYASISGNSALQPELCKP